MRRTAGTRAQARAASAPEEETRAGREAADRLIDEWPKVEWVPNAPSEAWARGALEQLAKRMRAEPALFRASREGSERGAETLSPDPFHGVVEVLQNADDLAAPELRIAIRHGGAVLHGARVGVLQLDGHHVKSIKEASGRTSRRAGAFLTSPNLFLSPCL